MSGTIHILRRYTRSQIRSNRSVLFVFGDNLSRIGFGGQAAEARGEPNSVGIVTKISPSRYLNDDYWELVKDPIVIAFDRLRVHLLQGENIVWPEDGVGTGLADLSNRAPMIAMAIDLCKEHLFSYAAHVKQPI